MKVKNRTEPIRADKEMNDFIKSIQAEKLMKEKRMVTSSRITKAMMNQYKKYPFLISELRGADLK